MWLITVIQRKQERWLGKKIKAAQEEHTPRGPDAITGHLLDFCDLAAAVRPWGLRKSGGSCPLLTGFRKLRSACSFLELPGPGFKVTWASIVQKWLSSLLWGQVGYFEPTLMCHGGKGHPQIRLFPTRLCFHRKGLRWAWELSLLSPG